MSAIDDLMELVERAGAAERAALASKWKERSDVEALQRKVRHAIDEQRDLERRAGGVATPTDRRAELREAFLQGDLDGPAPAPHRHRHRHRPVTPTPRAPRPTPWPR